MWIGAVPAPQRLLVSRHRPVTISPPEFRDVVIGPASTAQCSVLSALLGRKYV